MGTPYGGGGNYPSIKVEPGAGPPNGSSLQIKSDPDTAPGSSPAASQLDEDIYEDAGDLDFSQAEQSIFLTRLPKFLWETWTQLDDDQEITVGRVRVEGQQGDVKRMSLMLDASVPKNKPVPKEYNLHITNPDSFNTFVFSEKDLPGFGKFGPGSQQQAADKAPSHWLNRKRMERKRMSHQQHQQNAATFRRAIPKQTALSGRVRTEINCLPVENDEYHRITEQRALLALRPRMRTKVLDDVSSGNLLNPGTMGTSAADFKNFINRAGPARRKGQLLKTTRMPQNELIDLVYDCFKEYTYWPFKVLKDRVQQPEQYLRQTLEMIAFQAKSGTHMMEWQLRPEAKIGTYAEAGAFDQAKDEAAPDDEGEGGADADEEDDDENVDMEDVPLE